MRKIHFTRMEFQRLLESTGIATNYVDRQEDVDDTDVLLYYIIASNHNFKSDNGIQAKKRSIQVSHYKRSLETSLADFFLEKFGVEPILSNSRQPDEDFYLTVYRFDILIGDGWNE